MKGFDLFIPWSAGLDAHRHRALRAVVEAARSLKPNRLVLVEAVGGGDPDPDVPGVERFFVRDAWNKSRLLNMAFRDLCVSDWGMMLDGDVLPGEGLAAAIGRAMPNWHAIVPFCHVDKLDEVDTSTVLSGSPCPERGGRTRVNVPFGGAVLVRRDVFLHLRGFDERMSYMEDTDLAWRFRRHGGLKMYRHGAPALHLWHPRLEYPVSACYSMFERRRHLNFAAAVSDTESCIAPQDLKAWRP